MSQLKMFLPLDLQYFSEEGGGGSFDGGSAGAGAATGRSDGGGTGEATQRPAVNPLLAQSHPQPTEPAPAPTPEEQRFLDFGGRQVPYNPELEPLLQDWQQLNRFAQMANQRAIQAEQQAQMAQQYLMQQQMMAQMQAQQQQPQQPQLTPEEIEARNQAFLDKFYEDPVGTFEKTAAQLLEQQRNELMQQFQPILKEREFNQQFNALGQKYGDITPYAGMMSQVLNEMPHLEHIDGGLETLYLIARGRVNEMQLQQAMQQSITSVDQVLANPEWRQQILANEEIQRAIQQQYIQNVQTQQQQTPNVMGRAGQGQAFTPVAPEERPKTLQQASQSFRAWLRNQGG